VLPTLITIPISHYGERARWALDHAAIDYDEEHHVQVFSWLAAYRKAGRKFLPVLVTEAGVLDDSAAIVRYASERAAIPLYPDDAGARDEVLAWEARFAGAYGVETRRVCYEWTLRAGGDIFTYNAGAAPGFEVAALGGMQPVARVFMRRYMDASPEAAARGREVTRETMDAVAQVLADGRRYLTGDRFTAADLTFAAMSAPALLPAEYGVPLPPLDAVPTTQRRRSASSARTQRGSSRCGSTASGRRREGARSASSARPDRPRRERTRARAFG
jgi:glutathione S-transferase